MATIFEEIHRNIHRTSVPICFRFSQLQCHYILWVHGASGGIIINKVLSRNTNSLSVSEKQTNTKIIRIFDRV